MQSFLQKRIRNYLDSTGLSISALERKAGLRINVARNILRGQSKRPTAETLHAIATAMECTVQDLLGVQKEVLPSQIKHPAESGLFLESPEVLNEALQCILQVIQSNGYKLTVKQTLLLLEEVYAYTLKKSPPKVDADFVEWFVKRTIG
ncbi:MAG: helix-turn-helix transcriptional regulator [Alphaproteobacteria bacterium]|nr:helix-turn-helix transcriptional regulator [Alphaproteobacteria bacterium]